MDAHEENFNSAAEQAKTEFQAHIGSLLELQTLFLNKLAETQERQKAGAFFTNEEMVVIKDWILQTSTNLMADYVILDRTNRLTNKLYCVATKLANRRTPNLKDLAA